MSEDIAVSIICITYNHEPYIRDCLEGFIKQKTNFKFEVLIHDDASTDNTANIIREYERKYPDIIKPIYQTENQYSKGVKISKTFIHPKVLGKYIALCEGDDYWCNENKLQIQYDFMETNPEYICCVGGAKILDYMNGTDPVLNFPTRESREITIEEVVLVGNLFPTATYFYRTSYLDMKNIFSDLNLSFSDYTLILNLSLNGKIYSFYEVFSIYRFGVPGSWSVRNNGIEEAISVRNQNAILLEKFNQETNNVYKKITEQFLLKYDFSILLKQGKKKELKRAPYRKLYMEKYGFKIRVKTYLATKFPILLKIKKAFRGSK